MGKRQFTAEFKTQLVLEVLRGERELGAIALEHQINPNHESCSNCYMSTMISSSDAS